MPAGEALPEATRLPSTPRTKDVAVEVARLAQRQWGVVARRQLALRGLSQTGITRWIETGRLHRIHRGVYAVGHRSLTTEGWLAAALLRAGPGAVLSHLTAAWWWRILPVRPARIHVSTPGRSSSAPGICVHQPRQVERVRHLRLPLTPVARTLLDCASLLEKADLRRALAEAEYLGLVELDAVAARLQRGRSGSAALREALARHRPQLARTRSVLEERFLALCEEHELPLPEVNAAVCGLLVDALWIGQRLVVELDGHAAHHTRAAIERDRRRELTLRRAGHRVLRYTWEQVTGEPGALVADLRAALECASPPSRAPA
jgi:predicted transcriptional regulator of viral defense system